jgi:hypothetical protein
VSLPRLRRAHPCILPFFPRCDTATRYPLPATSSSMKRLSRQGICIFLLFFLLIFQTYFGLINLFFPAKILKVQHFFEIEFKALIPIDTYFTFKDLAHATLDEALKITLFTTALKRAKLQSIWARHHLRQGQRKWRVLFRKGILIQLSILCDNFIAF